MSSGRGRKCEKVTTGASYERERYGAFMAQSTWGAVPWRGAVARC